MSNAATRSGRGVVAQSRTFEDRRRTMWSAAARRRFYGIGPGAITAGEARLAEKKAGARSRTPHKTCLGGEP